MKTSLSLCSLAGNFGSALVRILGRNATRHDVFDDEVRMYVHEEMIDGKPLTEIINSTNENVKYLKGAKFTPNVVADPSLESAVSGATMICFCLPHQFLKPMMPKIKVRAHTHGRERASERHARARTLHARARTTRRACHRRARTKSPFRRPPPRLPTPSPLSLTQASAAPGVKCLSAIKGIDFDDSGIVLISDILRKELNADCSVLMGANVANDMASDAFCETTIGYKDPANGEVRRAPRPGGRCRCPSLRTARRLPPIATDRHADRHAEDHGQPSLAIIACQGRPLLAIDAH